MIPIQLQAEPTNFDSLVRQPGLKILGRIPPPTTQEIRKKNYWKHCLTDLRSSYSGICSYTSMYLVGRGSVDHFFPIHTHSTLTYEWDNYRYCRQDVNQRKGAQLIVDPCRMIQDTFILDLPSCLIKVSSSLNAIDKMDAKNTVDILGLNSDDNLVQERCDILIELAKGNISMPFLEARYPFLAYEINRLGVLDDLSVIFCVG